MSEKKAATLLESEELMHQTLAARVEAATKILKNERLALQERIASLTDGLGRDRALGMLQQVQGALKLARILNDGGTAVDFARNMEDTPLPAVGHTIVMFGAEAVQIPLQPYTPREGVEPAPPESTSRFRREQLERGI